MSRSNEYHSVGVGGETDCLKSYMNDLKKQYERCVKGQDPPSGARSWDEYFDNCEKLAEAVRMKNEQIMNLRAEALRSAEAVQAVQRGLFSQTSWVSHVDQIIGHAKALGDVDTFFLDLFLYREMRESEKERYLSDLNGYKFTRFREEAYMDQLGAGVGHNQYKELRRQMEAQRAGMANVDSLKAAERRANHQRKSEEKFADQVRAHQRLEEDFLKKQTDEDRLANMDVLDNALHDAKQSRNK